MYQGFSLLTANREVFVNPEIRAMAVRYEATLAQLIFRFAMQVGMLPLTGTTDAAHMREDLRALDLQLSEEDVATIERISG
jgi:diketogulonate reductase-like aldo/keto reductase